MYSISVLYTYGVHAECTHTECTHTAVSYTPIPGGEAQGEHRHDGLQRAGVGHRKQDAARLVSQLVGWLLG